MPLQEHLNWDHNIYQVVQALAQIYDKHPGTYAYGCRIGWCGETFHDHKKWIRHIDHRALREGDYDNN